MPYCNICGDEYPNETTTLPPCTCYDCANIPINLVSRVTINPGIYVELTELIRVYKLYLAGKLKEVEG